MPLRETFITRHPEDESAGKIKPIDFNKTLLIDQFSADAGGREPEFVEDIRDISDAFARFKPCVEVRFTGPDGEAFDETLCFNCLQDFEALSGKGPLVENSIFLSGLRDLINNRVFIRNTIASVPRLRDVLEDAGRRELFAGALKLMADELADPAASQAESCTPELFELVKIAVPGSGNMDPASKAVKKVFLSDSRFSSERRSVASLTDAWLSVLQGNCSTAAEFAAICLEKEEEYRALLSGGITDAMAATREIEAAYRNLDNFFKSAGPGPVGNLRVISVYKDDICDPGSGFMKEVDSLLQNGIDRLSLRDCYSLMVISGNVFKDRPTLLQWAKMAYKYKVLLIVDHGDEYSFEDLYANTLSCKDSDTALMNVVMTANWIVGRPSEPLCEHECETPAFYVYPSGALAGKMYDESVGIAQGSSGSRYGILSGVSGARFDFSKAELTALMRSQLVPMVYIKGKVMAYNNTTLYDGDLTAMREYPIVRVFDWVKKVLMNYVHEVALENWDPYNTPKNLKLKMQAFLNQFKGYGNLFQSYDIKEPVQNPVNRRVTCELTLTPFYAAKNLMLKVSAGSNDKSAELV